MTLVEIMIVVIIMALIAAGVGAAVLPRWRAAQRSTAATDASQVRSAAMQWVMEHSNDCPNVEQLQEDGMLDRHKRTEDPWGHAFSIECTGDDVLVASAGPNGELGDDDDVRPGQTQ